TAAARIAVRPALIQLFNRRPRVVGLENLPVLLSGAGPPDGSPLAQPHAVSRPRPGRDQAAHLPRRIPGDEQLERGAVEQATGVGPQYAAYIGLRDSRFAAR